VTGGGVTSINADLRVGAVSETITVVGETPAVDVQTQYQTTGRAVERIPQEIPPLAIRQRARDGARDPIDNPRT
jgi:hypothetical protein